MNKVISFFKESYFELKEKVTWPKWGELQNSSTLVLIASTIFALVIFGMDRVFEAILGAFYNSF